MAPDTSGVSRDPHTNCGLFWRAKTRLFELQRLIGGVLLNVESTLL